MASFDEVRDKINNVLFEDYYTDGEKAAIKVAFACDCLLSLASLKASYTIVKAYVKPNMRGALKRTATLGSFLACNAAIQKAMPSVTDAVADTIERRHDISEKEERVYNTPDTKPVEDPEEQDDIDLDLFEEEENDGDKGNA